MTQFRHRPVTVRAIRWTGSNLADVLMTFAAYPGKVVHDPDSHSLLVNTTDGRVRCMAGDWVVRDEVGDFYPHRNVEFQRDFEPVTQPDPAYEGRRHDFPQHLIGLQTPPTRDEPVYGD